MRSFGLEWMDRWREGGMDGRMRVWKDLDGLLWRVCEKGFVLKILDALFKT